MGSRRITVLSIEDDQACAKLLQRALADAANVDVDFHWAQDRESALEQLAGRDFDMVFLDYDLGTCTGLDVLQSMRDGGCMVPVVMVTAQGDEYVAVQVTRAGADGYVVKQDLNPKGIAAAIASAWGRAAERVDATQLLQRIDQLEALSRSLAESNFEIALDARIDPLTELFNRRAWAEAATTGNARALETGEAYVIVMADVDNFKKLNDTSGHQAGDECLQAIAHCLRDTCGPADLVGRLGGEEFALLIPKTTLVEGEKLAAKILDAVRALGIPHAGLGADRFVSLSMGLAAGPDDGGWKRVMRRADQALYQAKREGRCRACTATAGS